MYVYVDFSLLLKLDGGDQTIQPPMFRNFSINFYYL